MKLNSNQLHSGDEYEFKMPRQKGEKKRARTIQKTILSGEVPYNLLYHLIEIINFLLLHWHKI
jgi:sensor domain CHASE-containing protein